MWARKVTREKVGDLYSVLKNVHKEVSSWEFRNDIPSEAFFRVANAKDLLFFESVDWAATSEGLEFQVEIEGYNKALRGGGNFGSDLFGIAEIYLFEPCQCIDIGIRYVFQRDDSNGSPMIVSLYSSSEGNVRTKSYMNYIEGDVQGRELMERIKRNWRLVEDPEVAIGVCNTGYVELGRAISLLKEVYDSMGERKVGVGLTISASMMVNEANKREVGEQIDSFTNTKTPIDFRWEVSIDLRDGHPCVGSENDGLLSLCDKLIYLGTYDEGEGEVHVSLLEKRGGGRHLALDSKYPLLKSQMPPSLRSLEWKRG